MFDGNWMISRLRSPVMLKVGPPLFYTSLFVLFFSPVIFAGRLLAPNDGVAYGLPNFYAEKTLWSNLLFSGYPLAADPQAQTWYPLAYVFPLFPNSWNAYTISAYVLSACFMFGYMWTVTRSRLAGLVGGLAFSMSGFMIGRLGQVPMIHAMAWLPLLFWALEKNRHQPSAGWTVAGSLAIACSFLGGHTQIIFFGLIVAGAYVVYLGWYPAENRWRYFKRFSWMAFTGVGLIAIQLLPAMELAEWSARAKLSYSEFVKYSLAPKEALTLGFPYLFGGGGTLYGLAYFGMSNGMELPGYLGLTTLILGGLAVACSWTDRLVRFWAVTIAVAFALALGGYTPLGQIMFHLPGVNKFRAPIRHFMEITLAASVLAAVGAACIQRKKVTLRQMTGMLGGASGMFGLALFLIWVFSESLDQIAKFQNPDLPTIISWQNAALWVPAVIMAIAVSSLVFWWRKPESPVRRFLILVVLVADLGSFGWFHNWHYFVPPVEWIQPPETAERYRKILMESHQRLAPVEGIHGEREEFPVNLSMLWGLPSATGYNPMMLSRVQKVLSIYESGSLSDTWSSAQHRVLDILGVRFILLPHAWLKRYEEKLDGIEWMRENLGIRLGNGCNRSYPPSMTFSLPKGFSATRIGIVSRVMCSDSIPDGKAVLKLQLSDEQNVAHRMNMLMGRDTAEWGYDCDGIREKIRHRKAKVFRTFQRKGAAGKPCHGNQYVTSFPVSSSQPLKHLQIEWLGQPGIIQLDKIVLVDEPSGSVLPLRELTASDHWRFRESIWNTVVYENLDAMPRAWLVPEVVSVPPNEILHALHHVTLPDGRRFDPSQMAMIEEPYTFKASAYDAAGTAEVVQLENTEIIIRTKSTSQSFLVTSDIYYPGWEATVDGKPSPIYRTDYVLRGLPLPPGSHEIRFEFRPKPFLAGVAVTGFSALLMMIWFFSPFLQSRF